jgi:hypothetical protein
MNSSVSRDTKPSPIRTVTVGFGLSPNPSLEADQHEHRSQPVLELPDAWLAVLVPGARTERVAGSAAGTQQRRTTAIPPVGNCTLPRRSCFVFVDSMTQSAGLAQEGEDPERSAALERGFAARERHGI